jgi:hypothetical protein
MYTAPLTVCRSIETLSQTKSIELGKSRSNLIERDVPLALVLYSHGVPAFGEYRSHDISASEVYS